MEQKTFTFYEFDAFRVDAGKRCLWHSDELVSLTPKAFETLLALIRHRGEIVDKEVLLDEVWADTFVEESTLSQNILTLRKALSVFEKDKPFIVTVPRRGYRFVADVREIVCDDEFLVVERRSRTHIVARQHEIHDSADPRREAAAAVGSRKHLYLVVLGLALVTAGIFAFRYSQRVPSFVETKFERFTQDALFSDADIQRAIVSPDGKYLAFIKKRGPAESLHMRQIAEAHLLEIVPKLDGQFIGVTFSPANDYVYYAVYPRTDSQVRQGELYKAPVLGGPAQQIAKDIDSPVSISSDNKRIAFVRRDLDAKETALITADIDGTNEKITAVRKFGEGFLNAAFSPDGAYISCVANLKGDPARPVEIVIVNANTGEQRSLTTHTWLWLGQTVWLRDGSGIALVGYSPASSNLTDEIWLVSFPEGKARLLEGGLNGVFGLSLTDDGNSLVTVRSNKITSFVVSSLAALASSTPILTKTGDESLLPLGADWTTDETLLYSTTQNGNADIWSIKSDGSEQTQLTSDRGADLLPTASADGRFIYFLSNRSGQMSVWRTDGKGDKKITDGQDVFSVDLSPDDKWVYYTARSDSIFTQTLWRISPDGKDARQMTDKTTLAPRVSPDGKLIACYFPVADGRSLKLTLLLTETGEPVRQIETPTNDGPLLLEWKLDGRGLLFTARENGITSLWDQPVDGTAGKKIEEWQTQSIFRLAVSKNGDKLFYEQGVTANTVMLLRSGTAED